MKTIFQSLFFRLVLRRRQSFGGVFARVLQADALQQSTDEVAGLCFSGTVEKYVNHRQR